MDRTSTLQARLTPAARQKYPTYPAHIHRLSFTIAVAQQLLEVHIAVCALQLLMGMTL